MESTKAKGIVLFSRDYQESDKLLTILTLEYGKITVKAKSVRTAKSKLKIKFNFILLLKPTEKSVGFSIGDYLSKIVPFKLTLI